VQFYRTIPTFQFQLSPIRAEISQSGSALPAGRLRLGLNYRA
jgi:hypothetical protein